MKIVFKKNANGVSMDGESAIALRKKIITESEWRQFMSEASHYIQYNRSNTPSDTFVWKSAFDVAEEHGKAVYLYNKGKYWCVGVVVQETSGAIKVIAADNDKTTLCGHRVYIEDGDILYTEKDEALPKPNVDEDGFEEIGSDFENTYNNYKDAVHKAGTVLGGLMKELKETANNIASDVVTQLSEHVEKVMDEYESKKNSSKEETSSDCDSDEKTNKKDSTIDKTIRFYQIVRLKARLATLNKKKSDIEVDIEKVKKQIDELEKESV